jgi:phospholipid/cholesterol/gamma-HCH transport system permease protein
MMRRSEQVEKDHWPCATLTKEGALVCEGAWTLPYLARLEHFLRTIVWPSGRAVRCDASRIMAFDIGGAVLLQRTLMSCRQHGCAVSVEGLRPKHAQLFDIVLANWSVTASAPQPTAGWIARLDRFLRLRGQQIFRALGFVGESVIMLGRSLVVPSRLRWRAVLNSLDLDGVKALPITGLLTFLVGVVIAYQGAEQLRKFGTNIFIVDLVGISLLREISPLIVAILVAGRSGSSYAAQIGTMKVTEELDAVRTLGLSPINLLVLPRAVALVIALPLLTMYADVMGNFGGMLIALTQLKVTFAEFVHRFEEAVALRHFLIGLGKAPFFAMIIALVGCYQGLQIRGGVDDVGRHTTISVVQSIFLVIIFDAICSIFLNWWNL